MLPVKTLRHAAISLLALSTTVLAACGHNTVAGVATLAASSSVPTAMVAGHKRAFGYDLQRWNKVLKFQQHPVHLTRQATLPGNVDNRQWCSPVADQGQLGSCTAFSMAKGLREFMQNKNGETPTAMSALWLYYNERAHMGKQYIKQDSGANLSDGQFVLQNLGCATEASDAYNIAKFTVKPTAAMDATAAAWKISAPVNLANLDDVKTAIANGGAVAFGFTVYQSFENIGADGMMPMPKQGESVLGGHAVLAVGYDDEKKALIIRNSWGGDWGDHGYFYMPYAFASDAAGDASDWWTAAK